MSNQRRRLLKTKTVLIENYTQKQIEEFLKEDGLTLSEISGLRKKLKEARRKLLETKTN